jgi:hypothetical protein
MKIKNVKLTISPTKSSTYFLPIMDKLIKFKFLHLLQNSYVFNSTEEGAFGVLYKWSGKQDFVEWEEELMDNHLFVGHEDYDDYVLYKFKLPKNATSILSLFIQGKYSEYTQESKELVKEFLDRRGFMNYERIFKIMNLDESIRLELGKNKGEELSLPPDMNTEIFLNSVKFLSSQGGVSEF